MKMLFFIIAKANFCLNLSSVEKCLKKKCRALGLKAKQIVLNV